MKNFSAMDWWVIVWNEETTTFQPGVSYGRIDCRLYRLSCNGYWNPWKVVSIVQESGDAYSDCVNKEYITSIEFFLLKYDTADDRVCITSTTVFRLQFCETDSINGWSKIKGSSRYRCWNILKLFKTRNTFRQRYPSGKILKKIVILAMNEKM